MKTTAPPKMPDELGRFDHHPDAAIDFCIEVECLESRVSNALLGISKPGTKPETLEEILPAIANAMLFRVGGDEGAVSAKQALRALGQKVQSATIKPYTERERVLAEALVAVTDRFIWPVKHRNAIALAAEIVGSPATPVPSLESLLAKVREQLSVARAKLRDPVPIGLDDMGHPEYSNDVDHHDAWTLFEMDKAIAMLPALDRLNTQEEKA